jgi:hypothetical protein
VFVAAAEWGKGQVLQQYKVRWQSGYIPAVGSIAAVAETEAAVEQGEPGVESAGVELVLAESAVARAEPALVEEGFHTDMPSGWA